MKFINGTTDIRLTRTAVTLGKFDGLHRGHQVLLNELAGRKKEGYTTVMFTFQCHPMNLFSDKEVELINTETENRYYLEQGRIPAPKPDILIAYPFTRETADMSPEAFVSDILSGRLDAKIIVVGSDYRFGKDRRGNISLLGHLSARYGYELVVKDKLNCMGSEISSTRIRSEIIKGDMELARRLLGYPYTIFGTVEHGRNMGHKMLLPTINLYPQSSKLLPPNGVYHSITRVDGREYFGVTNIGLKPTVGGESRKGAETYLFDFDRDIYGRQVEVELYHFERPERRFSSIDELRSQILKDADSAREYFRRHVLWSRGDECRP